MLDEIDRRVLNFIQAEFPLCRSPYRTIGERTGLTEQEAEARVADLRRRGLIRRIGGVMDSRKLGLVGTLVAMKVPPERIDEVAAVINAVPNITHNYLRDCDYNIWFTVTAPSREAVTDIVAEVAGQAGVADVLELPSVKTFKIKVQLEFETGAMEEKDERSTFNVQHPTSNENGGRER